jgi:UDP-N-acetylmuramoylalanine--D-glutamate ligase
LSGRAAEESLLRQGYAVDTVEGYDVVVASPGIAVKSELQLGCEELKRRGWKLLAVTGSKGKSSVVKLVADALGAVACGNYGLSVCALCASGERPRWAVVEVSSFQLETTALPADTFEAAVILNLQEDHLDRHGSPEVYHALKLRLLSMAKKAYVPGSWPDDCAALMAGSYFDNPVLRANGGAGVALMRAAGLGDEAIAEAFARFRPLPHRFERVFFDAERDIEYIDDSKATSIEAMRAAISMVAGKRRVRLIAGGLAKGDDPRAARSDLTERVKKVYLIGRSAEVFRDAWQGAAECEICRTMDEAVAKAAKEAERGDSVLLSPAAASFDQFENFGKRGDVFAELVKKEGQRK